MADVRLIDANALIKMMVAENNRHPGASWEISDIERYVTKLLPTINPDDLRPRGRWVWDGHNNEEACSVCKTFAITEYCSGVSFCSNYCPNCGAKMDGKENEDA